LIVPSRPDIGPAHIVVVDCARLLYRSGFRVDLTRDPNGFAVGDIDDTDDAIIAV
jgi:hypothetical protein